MTLDFYRLEASEFAKHKPWPFNVVKNVEQINQRAAREAVDTIAAAGKANKQVMIITPVGPLDYSYLAKLCNDEGVSCEPLVTLNMDEYIDDSDDYISDDHPLGFRRFIEHNLIANLRKDLRPDPKNIHFPDPHNPQATTELVESFGGADLCFGGNGITGHFAFNDPPEPGEPVDDDAVKNSRTRNLTVSRESMTQMCMGGSGGNWDIIPPRAVTLGMYELLLSKKIHLTYMRNWHAGVLRRVLFGPVTGRCPGSFIQEHSNVEVSMTQLASQVPMLDILQATGEESQD